MSDLREKVMRELYDECFVPAGEEFGDANAAALAAEKADKIISMVLDSAIEVVNKQNRYVYDNKLINRIDVIKALGKQKTNP